ncbi:hypothetical protein N7493_005967 [Penicillium malachiteum]|uniref:Uncharacterized protein n=1 Tax=Penicillium malachiteum TaxID=1324776 RepID=A0AAD6HLB9_9EURO|nr:hypothetical protein N7493_005967 [Penicillium malachiteum]
MPPKQRVPKKEGKTKASGPKVDDSIDKTEAKTEEKPNAKKRSKKEKDSLTKRRKTDAKVKREKETATTKSKPPKCAADAKVTTEKTQDSSLSGLTVEEITRNALKRKSPEPRKKWKIEGPPITDSDKVPEGWTVNEDDIDEFDIEANIERNIERIKEGILPQFFKVRLMRYEQMKRDRDTFRASEPGVGGGVRVRIDTLKRIQSSLVQDGDPDDQLLNVKAVIEAYRTKKLKWNPPQNLATYLEELGHPKSWWVEGWDGPGPNSVNFIDAINPMSPEVFTHEIRLAIRPAEMPEHLKRKNKYVEYDFLDDTGSQNMLIYESDRYEMENVCNDICQEMGQTFVNTAAGSSAMRVVHLEVTILSSGTKRPLVPWTKVACYIMPGARQPGEPRLSGIWLRHMLYTLTRPDNHGMLYISDEGFHESVNIELPVQPRPPPALSYFPRRGAGNGVGSATESVAGTEEEQEGVLGYLPWFGPIRQYNLPAGHWYGYSDNGYPGYNPPRNINPLLDDIGAAAERGGFLRRMWRYFTPDR